MTPRILLTLVALCGLLRADLQQAKDEPNLEKRAMLALDNAAQALTQFGNGRYNLHQKLCSAPGKVPDFTSAT